ncbi:MAG: YjbQ family protein [Candidatus Omnitrophica bacterium]|nr:YjbQ family protein [Candidatus Omnitrophota bacterium]
MLSFSVPTTRHEELLEITPQIEDVVSQAHITEGLCHIFVPHTTCGLTINENADPTVRQDILKGLSIIPEHGFAHAEGNSPAHIKSSLLGHSLTIFVKNSRLALGRWQGIYLAEFDGPRTRKVWVSLRQ